ncbi:HXXEE domain-containing protein [Paenibacillus hemerocallicola]|uniref:HXXEE domain-containing protein n=1 Tax=Paenibacillus hemerocallicola TaxID=1172614 RepID=A0A5C4T632_9BACL|nr:HXXEE domain-containing protein [Paenibacillus hemerocallicola]TNJ64492.1 HXXEE domain-containing protein [Paenibacillus hemerocallicola]
MLLDLLNAHIHLLSLLWLFPVLFLFHDFEEILTVEHWSRTNGERIMRTLPSLARQLYASSFRMNTRQFAADVLWVYTVIVAATAAAVFFSFYLPYLAALAVFFLHVFTHAGQSLYLKSYTPGVITAIALVLPYSAYAYYRLLSEQIIDSGDILASLSIVIVLVPVALMLLLKGRRRHSIS